MAWLSRVNFVSSDTLSFTDVNNLGNDIRAWGDNVNGGGYTLSNVVLSASSGTIATVTGGVGAASTLTIRSTSGAGTTDAIVFQTGSQSEAMRIASSGNVGIGSANAGSRLTVSDPNKAIDSTGNVTIFTTNAQAANFGGSLGLGGLNGSGGAFDPWSFATIKGAKESSTSGNFAGYFSVAISSAAGVLSERMRVDSAGNVKIGGTADRATTAGTNQVMIFNGTAPVGTLANGASFYATAGEMRVMDAAGNATLLSPHDADTNEWIYDSTHTPTGKRLRIRVEALMRFVDEHFGLGLVAEDTLA